MQVSKDLGQSLKVEWACCNRRTEEVQDDFFCPLIKEWRVPFIAGITYSIASL